MRIVITGASSGIGLALYLALMDENKLYACSRRGWPSCDVTDESQVSNFMHLIPELDAVINCAGVLSGVGSVTESNSYEWFKTMNTNVYGAFLIAKYSIPKMKVPRLINFAGGGAFDPYPNFSAYATSKAAVVRFTECLASEHPDGYINCISPGYVDTPIHKAALEMENYRTKVEQEKLKSDGKPDRVIECVKYLLEAKVTGKTISARWDPWPFRDDINHTNLYTMRRVA